MKFWCNTLTQQTKKMHIYKYFGLYIIIFHKNILVTLVTIISVSYNMNTINLLTPNVNYSGRTAPITSKVAFFIFIQQI